MVAYGQRDHLGEPQHDAGFPYNLPAVAKWESTETLSDLIATEEINSDDKYAWEEAAANADFRDALDVGNANPAYRGWSGRLKSWSRIFVDFHPLRSDQDSLAADVHITLDLRASPVCMYKLCYARIHDEKPQVSQHVLAFPGEQRTGSIELGYWMKGDPNAFELDTVCFADMKVTVDFRNTPSFRTEMLDQRRVIARKTAGRKSSSSSPAEGAWVVQHLDSLESPHSGLGIYILMMSLMTDVREQHLLESEGLWVPYERRRGFGFDEHSAPRESIVIQSFGEDRKSPQQPAKSGRAKAGPKGQWKQTKIYIINAARQSGRVRASKGVPSNNSRVQIASMRSKDDATQIAAE
ncbi:hypothetical protein C8R47DRAFT_1064184 [Mycena vitilis]|nr:hypothetical protein C8R47DRAFT_1064184 [Mycena vitilis]